MNPPTIPRRYVVGVVVVALIVLAATLILRAGRSGPIPEPSRFARVHCSALLPRRPDASSSTAYVDPDGRVVRRDQDGDTVSEGQAYAMLVAVALDDRGTFASVWSWTRQHLLREDQTLSWRWQNGSVVDASSASDADLDAARALVIAGQVFNDAELTAAGIRLGQAILDVETVVTPLGRILVAGNWARQDPYAYNPSYPSPVAFALLHGASNDDRWIELAAGSRAATRAFLDQSPLPPDWGQIDGRGTVQATAGAAGHGNEGVRYGYDAARTPLRYAESCSSEDVALAARLGAPLSTMPSNAALRQVDGDAIGTDESVVAIAGLAAAYAASGDQQRTFRRPGRGR